MRTLVIIPTYNERENIIPLLREIRALSIPELDCLVVDDASPDGTAALVAEEAAQNGRPVPPPPSPLFKGEGSEPRDGASIFLLNRDRKRGIGSASVEGFHWGISRGYEALLTMDADLSHDPRAIPAILRELRGGADVVVGSRRIPGGKIIGWNLWRRFTSWSANWFARALLSIPIRDVTSGYRAYRVSVLQKIDLGRIRTDGYAFQEELMWHLTRRRIIAIREVPITFRDREYGESKLGVGEALAFFAAMARLSYPRVLPPTVLGIGTFALYVATASRTIFPGDSMEFIAVIGGNGVAHPPGYPLYTLLGHLARALPWGELAFRLNLLSAFFGAAAVVAVYVLARAVTRSTPAAIFGALTLAIAPPFWLYSLVAEVFSLHTFLLALILYIALRFAENPSRKLLLVGAFLFGLGMTNHHTTLFLAPVLAALLWTRRKRFPKFWTHIGEAAGAFAIGLTPYLAIPFFARGNPVINWDSATNLLNLTRLFLRSDYGTTTLAPAALSFTPHTYAIHEFARFFFTHGFGALAALSVIGLWHLFRMRRRTEAWTLFGAAMLLGPVFALIARTGIVSVNQAAAFERFLIAPLVPLAILAAAGISYLFTRIPQKISHWAVPALAIVLLVPLGTRVIDLRNFTLYRDLTLEQLRMLPLNAIYLTTGELSDMATDYWQVVHGERPDVQKIAITKLPGDWYREQVRARFPELASYIAETLDETVVKLCAAFAAEGRLFAASWPNRLAGAGEQCAPIRDRLLVRVYPPDVPLDVAEYKNTQENFWKEWEVGHVRELADARSSRLLRVRRLLEIIAEMRHDLGETYARAGRVDWARVEFQKANEISPDWVESLDALAGLKAEVGDFKEALALEEEAIKRNKEHLWAYYGAGVYSLQLGENGDGELYLEKFLSFKPAEKFPETGRAKELLKAIRAAAKPLTSS